MVPLAKQCAFEEPSVETISGENVLTWPHVVSPRAWFCIWCLLSDLDVFLLDCRVHVVFLTFSYKFEEISCAWGLV